MYKRNSQYKNEASTGCVRETPLIKTETSTGCARETPQIKKRKKKKEKSQNGMCKRNTPQKKFLKSQHGMCKRNSPDKNEASKGCVRETPQMKMKAACDV